MIFQFPWLFTKFPDFSLILNFPDFSLTSGNPALKQYDTLLKLSTILSLNVPIDIKFNHCIVFTLNGLKTDF